MNPRVGLDGKTRKMLTRTAPESAIQNTRKVFLMVFKFWPWVISAQIKAPRPPRGLPRPLGEVHHRLAALHGAGSSVRKASARKNAAEKYLISAPLSIRR